jgi:hypothetical protein
VIQLKNLLQCKMHNPIFEGKSLVCCLEIMRPLAKHRHFTYYDQSSA